MKMKTKKYKSINLYPYAQTIRLLSCIYLYIHFTSKIPLRTFISYNEKCYSH